MDITLTFELDDEEVTLKLPAHYEVCSECEGHGSVLNASMREHGYTREEFQEEFDEEEQREYFRHGGMYDVLCPACKGMRVEAVVSEDKLSPEQRSQYEEYERKQAFIAQMDDADRLTRRREAGHW